MNNQSIIKPTWMDLWDYIQEAEVDSTGVHELTDGCTLHVYDHKTQVNIAVLHEDIPSLNVLFHEFDIDSTGRPMQVWLVPVSERGVANYDAPYKLVPIDEPIDDVELSPDYRHITAVRTRLIALLSAYKQAEPKQEVSTMDDVQAEVQSRYRDLIRLCEDALSGADTLIQKIQDSIGRIRAYRDLSPAITT